MKKSQELSLSTIIVAALAIIVLVVLVAIFTGRIGGFGTGAKEVEATTYSCNSRCQMAGYASGKPTATSCTAPAEKISGRIDDLTDTNKFCCCVYKTTP